MEEYTEEEDNKPILYEYILEICKSKEAQLPNVNINIIKNLLESTELPFGTNIELDEESDGSYRQVFRGYPSHNYIYQLCRILEQWNKVSKFPITFIPMDGFTDITTDLIQKHNTHTQQINYIFGLVTNSDRDDEQITEELIALLNSMSGRGILTCLGIRKTVGSEESAVPLKQFLIQSFQKLNVIIPDAQKDKRRSIPHLTVGARALSKHAHRSSEGFWGKVEGTEKVKNTIANNMLNKILAECVWINIHNLPHSELIIECRVAGGYGMRWTIDANFRGFLEPMMEGGHEKKWIH